MTSHRFETFGLESCPFMPVFGAPALELVRGQGTEVWDSSGQRYLDFLAGIAVVSLGHSNRVVAEAIAQQAATLVHVSNFFSNPVANRAALQLVQLLEDVTADRGQVFFTNSGAEANECALKLARRARGPGRFVVLSALGSFHGRTLATLAATGQPAKHVAFAPMPDGFEHVAFGDIDGLAAALDDRVAAVLIESVQGEGGVIPAPPGYLSAIRELCDRSGALMMIDEVQTGLGRTGRWFGFEHGLEPGSGPDVVTMAKALGNGMPVGACWAKREVAAAFSPGDHGSTYSGGALATAAVSAVIGEMVRLNAPALAAERGLRLSQALTQIDGVESVRGLGLLLGAELAPGLVASEVVAAALQRGLIVNAVTPTAIRLAPPLTVSDQEVDEAAEKLAEAITAVRTRS
jgi:predicted acetylornithine/succinylornithine family transaminase